MMHFVSDPMISGKVKFIEKLALQKYSEEINVSVWNEFERFLNCRSEQLAFKRVQEENERREMEQKEKDDREYWEELERLTKL